MRNFLLSAALIALPVMGFTLVEMKMAPKAEAASTVSALGDLSAFQAIADDTRKIAATGDMVAAEKRVRDLESLWDQNAAALQAKDGAAWGVIDGANDGVFSSLRATSPDPAKVDAALAALQVALSGQGSTAGAGSGSGVQQVAGIDVTDVNGHPLPCEKMAGAVRDALAGKTADPKVTDLQAKALERCNADDDANSDAFSAQALALLKG